MEPHPISATRESGDRFVVGGSLPQAPAQAVKGVARTSAALSLPAHLTAAGRVLRRCRPGEVHGGCQPRSRTAMADTCWVGGHLVPNKFLGWLIQPLVRAMGPRSVEPILRQLKEAVEHQPT